MNGRWRRISSLACGLLVLASVLLTATRARAEEKTKLLLLASPDAELAARVRGQTQDLGVVLEVVDPPAALSAESATLAGQRHSAQLVIWAQALGPSQLTLHVLDLQSGELRSRSVSTPAREALASSTTAEMAALVVRSELSSLLAEQRAKREKPTSPSAGTTPARAAISVHLGPSTAPSAAPTPQVSSLWLLGLGYHLARPIRGKLSHGIGLNARRDIRGFALGLSGIVSFPVHLSRAGTSASLQRLQLRVEALKHWQPVPSLRLLLGVAGEIGVDLRSTRNVAQGLEPARDATRVSGALGLFGEAQWRFSRAVGSFLAAGADAVPWRTKFVVQNESAQLRLASLSRFNPWLTVGLFTRF